MLGKADDIKAALKASKAVDRFVVFLIDDSGSLGLGNFVGVFAKMKTLGKKMSFEKSLEILQGSGVSDETIRGYLSDISKIKTLPKNH